MQAAAEVIPERDAELAAGLHRAGEGIAGVTTGVAPRAARDLALGHAGADAVLRAVGVERDVGALRNGRQLVLVGVQPHRRPVKGRETGTGGATRRYRKPDTRKS